MNNTDRLAEWRPRKDALLLADVFRRADVDHCPARLPTGDGPVAHNADIDFLLAFFEPEDAGLRAQYLEWRRERLGLEEPDAAPRKPRAGKENEE